METIKNKAIQPITWEEIAEAIDSNFTELNEKFGDINTILDEINGEVI